MSSRHCCLEICVSEGPLVRVANIPVHPFISFFWELGSLSVFVQTVLKRKTTLCRLIEATSSLLESFMVRRWSRLNCEHRSILCLERCLQRNIAKMIFYPFYFDKMKFWREFLVKQDRWCKQEYGGRWRGERHGRWRQQEDRWCGRWHQQMVAVSGFSLHWFWGQVVLGGGWVSIMGARRVAEYEQKTVGWSRIKIRWWRGVRYDYWPLDERAQI